MEMPKPPAGSGQHPIALVVISANDLAASSAFYASVFGWQMMRMSDELKAAGTPGGPAVALRAKFPDGFPGVYSTCSAIPARLVPWFYTRIPERIKKAVYFLNQFKLIGSYFLHLCTT